MTAQPWITDLPRPVRPALGRTMHALHLTHEEQMWLGGLVEGAMAEYRTDLARAEMLNEHGVAAAARDDLAFAESVLARLNGGAA